ncbi:MAG: protein phosphatase 2C domain-containing protein [Acidobacteria bacterium]|nr:protein phosphatase 2C domain-containing protein [Acidobacteriota bacterium]MCA1638646.1 protein phosphatase 2C domain-containing protein [Acidobacteriota bacterium]
MENSNQTEWRVIGETVPGASHLRAGTPNQDAILQVRESGRSLPIILSVADGHGSPKCFRSNYGSRFAVKKSAQIVGEFLDERRGKFDLAEIENKGKDYLPKEMVKKWRKTVEYHLKNNPFTEDEFKKLEEKSGANARKLIEENPLLAYGTTSLTVAMEEDFVLYLQLGDGDILNVSAAGKVTKPLPEDARLLANETTSMCLKDAEKDFRFFVQKISNEQSPALVLLSTDGYLNSFSDEAGFFQAGTDILNMLAAENGFDAVNENLKAWLEEATQMGSGDDCTVGIIYRPRALRKYERPEKSEVTTTTETPPSPETSQAVAALTDSQTVSPEDMENVTVTITIKKDKSKISMPSSVELAQKDSHTPLENSSENEGTPSA